MCTGALTAEMARSMLQSYVRKTGYDMDIRTVAVWDSWEVFFRIYELGILLTVICVVRVEMLYCHKSPRQHI